MSVIFEIAITFISVYLSTISPFAIGIKTLNTECIPSSRNADYLTGLNPMCWERQYCFPELLHTAAYTSTLIQLYIFLAPEPIWNESTIVSNIKQWFRFSILLFRQIQYKLRRTHALPGTLSQVPSRHNLKAQPLQGAVSLRRHPAHFVRWAGSLLSKTPSSHFVRWAGSLGWLATPPQPKHPPAPSPHKHHYPQTKLSRDYCYSQRSA